MQTFLILVIIVFTFCASIGLLIYDKDVNMEELAVTDDISDVFEEDKKDNFDDEII